MLKCSKATPNFPTWSFVQTNAFRSSIAQATKTLSLSRMRSAERQGEIRHFRAWANRKGYQIFEATDFEFEGCGDAIWNFAANEIFGGHGFRTDVRAYDQIEKIVGRPNSPPATLRSRTSIISTLVSRSSTAKPRFTSRKPSTAPDSGC